MRIAPEHVRGAVAGDRHDLHAIKAALEQARGRFVPQVVKRRPSIPAMRSALRQKYSRLSCVIGKRGPRSGTGSLFQNPERASRKRHRPGAGGLGVA
jgi:hypothetical protein